MTDRQGTDDEHIRVLIADDHPVFRSGLQALLAAADGLDVIGEATTGTNAVAAASDLQPDVVVMDLQMPGFSGIEATRRITRTSPHVGVLVLTMLEDDSSVFDAIRAGARGYVLKGADHAEIVHAIRSVGSGQAVFGSAVAGRIMDYFAAARGAAPAAFPELTEREQEVLDLIARSLSNQAIAARLHIAPKTVRNHVSNIIMKLQVADRAHAILRAREAGLGEARN